MSIKDLIDKFKNTPPDRTLVKNLLIEAKVINVPKKNLLSGYITLEDDSGTLEAVAPENKIYEHLSSYVNKKQILKLKGRLDKTEYGNIAFLIKEIIE